MERHAIARFALLGLGSILLLSTPALAYDAYRMFGGAASCANCHPDFIGEGPSHDLHVGNSQMTDTCRLCHTTNEDIPKIWTSGTAGGQGCRGCHGRDNGTMFGWGAGLRLHHLNAGAPADLNGQFCNDCHTDDLTPPGEDTLPVYYSRTDVDVNDPCALATPGGEDWDGDGFGLDNDGDLDYDDADADCGTGVGVLEDLVSAAGALRLSVAPNPFAAADTEIRFTLGSDSEVSVDVLSTDGRIVRRLAGGRHPAGVRSVRFDGRDDAGALLPSGVYFVRVRAAGQVETSRVVRLR